jgi:hypothetical protein
MVESAASARREIMNPGLGGRNEKSAEKRRQAKMKCIGKKAELTAFYCGPVVNKVFGGFISAPAAAGALAFVGGNPAATEHDPESLQAFWAVSGAQNHTWGPDFYGKSSGPGKHGVVR